MPQYKTFLISILSEGIIALLFRKTQWFGYGSEILLENHIIEWVLIAIIRPVIGLIRNSKEKNTKYLKIGLIIVEIFLFLLIFIQDGSNLNKREFLILYITILLIIKETIYKRQKKRQTIFYLTIYSIISIIIISIGILMRYRKPLEINNIIKKQDYVLITNFNEINNIYNSITLKNDYFDYNINISEGKKIYNIVKNIDYKIEFLSNKYNENNFIIIQDQLGNIVKIPPQTSLNFSTKNQQIQFIDSNRRTNYYGINETFPKELEEYKTNYNNKIKNEVLKTLPSMLRNNSKLQKISTYYTKLLGTIFPFWYDKNLKILYDYIPYFDIKESKNYTSINNKISIIKENESIGIKNINGWSKYRIF